MPRNLIDNVLIVTSEAFPHGMAGTNRIISLCKGFQANGLESHVISFFKYGEPGDSSLMLTNGIYEGIRYKNVFKSTIKNRWKIIRVLHEWLKTPLVCLNGYNAITRNTLVIYYSHETGPAIILRLLTRLKDSLLIKDETEHPLVRVKEGSRLSRIIFFRYHYRLFDGLTVITRGLYNYFISDLRLGKPVFLVPMIVDVDRFKDSGRPYIENIVFSGVLDDKKEGVGVLIRAFSHVIINHPGITLDLYGRAPDPDQEAHYSRLIADLDLEEKVMMHGYRTRDEMTEIFANGKVFAFTRPPSLQATYGFSTKLGEYLATGKPVLATRTGEIEQYLRDRENSFLCDPDVESVAAKLCEILDDYGFALKVGNEGRNCALEHFNNKTVTRIILDQIRTEFTKKTAGN